MSGADSFDRDLFRQADDQLSDDITNLWQEWNGAREGAKTRWLETQQYLNATSTRETANANVGGTLVEDDSGWSHSTHIPKLTQIADNLVANYLQSMMPHEDWFTYTGNDAESATKAQRLTIEGYLKTKHRLSKFRNKVQQLVNDWVTYGNCFARVDYVTEKLQDGVATGYIGPRITRISPYDIVFNAMATDFEHSPKIIRSLKTLGELARDAEDSPGLGYSQDALNRVMKMRSAFRIAQEEDTNKSIQLQFDGFGSTSQYFQSGYVEVLEFYGDIYDTHNNKFLRNRVITVIDKSFVIRNEELDTWNGRPNIYHCGWRLRTDNLWAMGPLDNLIGMQYLINHLENARADMFDQMIAPTRVLVGNVESDGVEAGVPGGEYRIPDGEGSVSNLLPDTTVLNADLQIREKMQQMEQLAGSPEQELGVKPKGEQTATQVNQLERASNRTFQNKTNYFEEQFLEDVLNAELEVAKRNLSARDTIKTLDSETGAELFTDITAEDITSNGKFVPIGSRQFARKNQLLGQLASLQQAMAQDQLLQQHIPSVKLAELYSELMTLDKFELIIPYGRIAEQLEAERLASAAQQQVEAEALTPVGDEDDIEPEEEISGI